MDVSFIHLKLALFLYSFFTPRWLLQQASDTTETGLTSTGRTMAAFWTFLCLDPWPALSLYVSAQMLISKPHPAPTDHPGLLSVLHPKKNKVLVTTWLIICTFCLHLLEVGALSALLLVYPSHGHGTVTMCGREARGKMTLPTFQETPKPEAFQHTPSPGHRVQRADSKCG